MKKFIVPELEISKFSMQDIVTVSGAEPVILGVNSGAITPFAGASGYSANDLKWAD